MPSDNADRADLYRFADDGCPNSTGDTHLYDLSSFLAAVAKDEA